MGHGVFASSRCVDAPLVGADGALAGRGSFVRSAQAGSGAPEPEGSAGGGTGGGGGGGGGIGIGAGMAGGGGGGIVCVLAAAADRPQTVKISAEIAPSRMPPPRPAE